MDIDIHWLRLHTTFVQFIYDLQVMSFDARFKDRN